MSVYDIPLHYTMDHFDLLVLHKSATVRASQARALSCHKAYKVGHNFGEINWHISALNVVKFMPSKFLDCWSSASLTGLIADNTTQHNTTHTKVKE